MDNELVNFIKRLANISNRTWNDYISRNKKGYKKTLGVIYDTVHLYNRPYDDKIMNGLLSKDHVKIPTTSKRNGRILLKPLEKDPNFLPLLSIDWDVTTKRMGNTIVLEMVNREYQVFSIRFDQCTPTSNHDFFHVQINDEIKGIRPQTDISWFPSKRPCIPLYDKCKDNSPVSLLILLYGSLYGFEDFDKDFKGSRINRDFYKILADFKTNN